MNHIRFHLITAAQVALVVASGGALALGLLWAIFTFIASGGAA
jgi:hypothetical protein